MAHFAKVVAGIVTEVIVAEADFIATLSHDGCEWVQTSYNTFGGVHYKPDTREPSDDQSKALRKNYAHVGGTYDRNRDAFIAPRPFPSWVLDEATCLWQPPTPMPTDGFYKWDEATASWLKV